MSTIVGSLWWMLVALGVLVTFHEFGHFWVARRCGVQVTQWQASCKIECSGVSLRANSAAPIAPTSMPWSIGALASASGVGPVPRSTVVEFGT